MHWVHCGDSRLYIVRDAALLTRTRDHSYMEQQAHLGRNTQHINRNILFSCLGSPAKPVFDLSGPLQLKQGDRVLLCSDGLWGTVNDDEVADIVATDQLPGAEQVQFRGCCDEWFRHDGRDRCFRRQPRV